MQAMDTSSTIHARRSFYKEDIRIYLENCRRGVRAHHRIRTVSQDGASRIQIFFYVTLPFIAPILVISAMFRLIDSVKAFPLIFLLTGGGPGSVTEVTNYYAYLLAFDSSEIGYSSAVTVVMLLLVVAVSFGVIWMGRRREMLA